MSCLAFLQLSGDSSGFFDLTRENPTPASRVRFIKWGNTSLHVLKLGYISSLFCSYVIHTCLIPFSSDLCSWLIPHLLRGCRWFCDLPWVGTRGRMEQGVREELWAMSESHQLIREGGFSFLTVHGLLPWHGTVGNLSPDWVL